MDIFKPRRWVVPLWIVGALLMSSEPSFAKDQSAGFYAGPLSIAVKIVVGKMAPEAKKSDAEMAPELDKTIKEEVEPSLIKSGNFNEEDLREPNTFATSATEEGPLSLPQAPETTQVTTGAEKLKEASF